LPIDHVDSSEISPTQFLAENWKRDTVVFVLRNRKLGMLVVETLPKLFMWAKFHWSTDFNVSSWTRNFPDVYAWNSPA